MACRRLILEERALGLGKVPNVRRRSSIGQWAEGYAVCGVYMTELATQLVDMLRDYEVVSTEVLQRLLHSQRLRCVLDYVAARLPEQIRLAEAASAVGMQHAAFSRYFSENAGITFFAFIRIAKIAQALDLLSRDEYKASELASVTGFNSQAAFARAFRLVTGVTPALYRRYTLLSMSRSLSLGGHPKCTTRGHLKMYQGSVGT